MVYQFKTIWTISLPKRKLMIAAEIWSLILIAIILQQNKISSESQYLASLFGYETQFQLTKDQNQLSDITRLSSMLYQSTRSFFASFDVIYMQFFRAIVWCKPSSFTPCQANSDDLKCGNSSILCPNFDVWSNNQSGVGQKQRTVFSFWKSNVALSIKRERFEVHCISSNHFYLYWMSL